MHPDKGFAIVILLAITIILAGPVIGAIIVGIVLEKKKIGMVKRLLVEIAVGIFLFLLGHFSGLFHFLLENFF